MALLDHFQPPLKGRRHWHSFHHAWATFISSDLNKRLPEGWFAEPNVQFGIEIDVATFDDSEGQRFPDLLSGWKPPSPVLTAPFTAVTDKVEVNIYDSTAGPVLAGAIELLSPAKKDRPASREAFVSKCETLIQQGVGLLLIDIVTERGGNLHGDLLNRLNIQMSFDAALYTASYHAIETGGEAMLEVWAEPLAIGQPLPTMPLWLRGGYSLPMELEATYQRTCLEQRIKLNGA
jgi:hypothetical protein